jgi:hypothetical protein
VNEQKRDMNRNQLLNETYVLPSTEQEIKSSPILQQESTPPIRAVEIRETYDTNGNVIDSQLVDLSTEFQSTKSSNSVSSSTIASDGSTASLSSSQEKSLDEVYNKLQERLNLMSENQAESVIDVCLLFSFLS